MMQWTVTERSFTVTVIWLGLLWFSKSLYLSSAGLCLFLLQVGASFGAFLGRVFQVYFPEYGFLIIFFSCLMSSNVWTQRSVYARCGYSAVCEFVTVQMATVQKFLINDWTELVLQRQHPTRSSCAGWSNRYAGGCIPVVFIFGTNQPISISFFRVRFVVFSSIVY